MGKKTKIQIRFFASIFSLGLAFCGKSSLAQTSDEKQNKSNAASVQQGNTVQKEALKDVVWVSQSDGAKSCSPGSGSDLKEGAEALKSAHIPVLDSRKGNDGRLHAQMCGAPQGSENSYLIPKEYLNMALALGYKVKK